MNLLLNELKLNLIIKHFDRFCFFLMQGTFNELDSQSMLDLLEATGFEIFSFQEENFVNTPIKIFS